MIEENVSPTQPLDLQTQLQQVLQDAQRSSGLEAILLTTPDGLELASVGTDASPDLLAGLSTLFNLAARQAIELMHWPEVDEVSLVNVSGLRLVTRRFQEDGEPFMLVLLVPAHQSYRRSTSVAIRRLRPIVRGLRNTSA